jgi:ATP-dependent Clp endopeptidase proteolytic subunit ClpP
MNPIMNPFCYVVNPEADEPIMLLDRHIGFDEDEGYGVDGSLFVRELMMLDQMEKKSIKVWINSPGGIVMDGYNIYNAILKTKTKVDTVCVGIAASIAAVIFQAGRNRVMNEYALLMYHNPYGGNSDELKKMRVSIAKMIASRTGKSEDEILKMMDKTTWITASEALMSGFCDSIEVSADFNKKRSATTDAKAMWKESAQVLNSIFKPKNKTMNKVVNKLGLISDASEESIVSAIDSIVNKKNDMEDKMKKMEDDYAEAKQECDKLKAQLDEMKQKAEDEAKKAEEEAKNAKKAEAKNMVEGFAKAGKIKNEAIEKWVAMAADNFEMVKNLLEELPVNKVANKIEVNTGDQGAASDANLTSVIARAMADTRNKFNVN